MFSILWLIAFAILLLQLCLVHVLELCKHLFFVSSPLYFLAVLAELCGIIYHYYLYYKHAIKNDFFVLLCFWNVKAWLLPQLIAPFDLKDIEWLLWSKVWQLFFFLLYFYHQQNWFSSYLSQGYYTKQSASTKQL